MKKPLLLIVFFLLLNACSKNSSDGYRSVKPRYHHSWYKNSIHKKNWHVGRVKLRLEKQGTKKVTMKR